jgi:hypothetical protein
MGQQPINCIALPNFDLVPNPAFNLVDLSQYTESHEGPLPEAILTPLMYLETSRGCRQVCDFCSTPFTKGKYRYMNQSRIEEILQHYKRNGITSLLLCEDNILSRLDFGMGRKAVIDWFKYMREQGFTWEFSNGVEIGKLATNGKIDKELIEILFGYENGSGCYRSYIPLERVDVDASYKKLKPFDIEMVILYKIVQQKVPLLNIGVIIGNPQETYESLKVTEERMKYIMDEIRETSGGKTTPYANIFLHIPIPGTNDHRRSYREGRLAFDINTNPELFNFYTSVIDGDTFSCFDITKLRREIALRLNGEDSMKIWENTGRYAY